MKIDNKLILEHSKNLNILYVEDDSSLRNVTKKIFLNYFKTVDTAVDGEEGLKKFLLFKKNNGEYYDLVISDINMPRMNGIDMSTAIVKENPWQSVIFITAHDEVSFLHSAIQIGVNGFLNKPLNPDQLKRVLYKTTQAVSDRKLVDTFYKEVEELNIQLDEQKAKLEEEIRMLRSQLVPAADTQCQQYQAEASGQNPDLSEPLISDYFAQDEDDGTEKVVFLKDDCDEMSEILNDLPELLMQYALDKQMEHFDAMIEGLSKISSILLHYTPFLDPLAESFANLSAASREHSGDFLRMLEENPDGMTKIYDSISLDMDRYIDRFSIESMAMKNIHHIHHPTTLSIEQIIGMISPQDIDEGEIEFF